MVNNIGQLFGREADIEGVADCTRTGNGEIEFQMLVTIPAKCAHSVAHLYPQIGQRTGKPAHSIG